MGKVFNFINGASVPASGNTTLDVLDPSNGKVLSQVPLSREIDVNAAVSAAGSAYVNWRLVSMKRRAAIVLKLSLAIESNLNEIASLISSESGKNLQESLNDVYKCLEMLEWAINLPQFADGSHYELTTDVVCHETRQSVGVVVAILPFSSLATVPMWSIPVALIMGNCIILKPSEKAPQTIQRIVELMVSVGVPSGVVQIVHGDAETATALCDHTGVHAVSFVGSSKVAEIVNKRCQAVNKRVLALGGAKNHLLALPDCDVPMTSKDVVAGFVGCAGQRCMAGSVLLLVGDGSEATKNAFMDHLVKEIVQGTKMVNAGTKATRMGPLIDKEAKERVLEYINEAEANGATILLDGRSWAKERTEGFWVGPTIILHNNVDDRAMKEEIFGPVLSVYVANSWDEAIAIENANPYGNAACIYTEKGANAEWFIQRFRASLLGINEAFAGSREPYSSGGVRGTKSHFGGGELWGEGCVDFFSHRVRTVSRWAPVGSCGSPSKESAALRPLSVPNRTTSLTPLSPTNGRKQLTINPRSPEFTLPLSRANSSKEGLLRRESSGTTREPLSRESSGLSDVTECDNSEPGEHHMLHHQTQNMPKKFHGIAATSPFASSDPHFDFDLEKLKREDSFQLYCSAQPSFDVDPHSSLGHAIMERYESKDWSVASGLTQEESIKSINHRTSAAFYNVDLYNVEALAAAQSDFVDRVVTEIGPQDAHLKYQHAAARYIKKLLRKALQCNIFETGLHGIRCFLPTDPLSLSVVLSGKLEPCWHTLARDGLLKAQNPVSPNNSDAASTDNKHTIKRVDCTKVGEEFKVTCVCDSTFVEISLNARNNVCILAFFEEVDVLVGSDNLFKRSLMLIRAWWHHETVGGIDASTRALLNDTAIAVMVCAIFNQFHMRISSPLQALCLFLAEYSAYDGATQAITLQGIVPFHGADGTQLYHIEPNKKHLLSPALIEKYQQLFNLADVVKAKSPQNGVHFAQPHAPVPVPEVPQAAPVVFVREAFNVLHPFMPANILAQPDETRLGPLSQLSRAFVEGGKNLSLALSKTYNAQSVAQAGEMVGAFENILRHRLGELPQEELVNALLAAESTSKTPPYGDPEVAVSVDKHWQNIMYCNFIIKSVVSESAILTFCIDVLSMIGLMTADDLGKRLNEASKVPQLMVALKDQVGGLKEFLKRFPDVFVFSFEHPYNPHIFLRIVLSPELQAEVENGVLPVKFLSQIIAKFGRIAPPPPKVDSPSMRRKMLVPTAPAAASHANNTLDEKVLFGHERSAGGANTLRLMQSDIDLVNVVGAEPPQPPAHHQQQQQQHNPYAPPFVPAQAMAPSRKTNSNGHLQQQAPALSLSLHGGSSLSGQPASYFQQDLNLSSGMGLGNTSLNKGNVSSNSSLAGSTGPSRLLYDLDYQDALLDGTDYFGDTLSLNGDARGTTSDLLSSLREDTLQVDDFSSPGLGLGSGLAAGLGGGAANSRVNGGYGGAHSNGRGRFPAPQSLDGFSGEFDFEAAAASSLDPYHQASTTSTGSAAAVGGLGAKSRYGGSHLLGGASVDDFNPSADAAYIPNTYGGYHGAADYQAQHGAHGHHPPPPPHHHHQQHAPQYGHGQQQAPTAYGPGARGMTRTNSRPLMLNPQGQVIGQQPPPQQQQQHKFQHKRYDASQQFKK